MTKVKKTLISYQGGRDLESKGRAMRMRSKMTGGKSLLLALTGAAALLAAPLPATAGHYHEHIYADAYGNLIIYSPSGYKQIVVGKGYLAEKLAAATGTAKEPKVLSLGRVPYGYYSRCDYRAVLLHGRSYMYGLPDNVVPTPAYDDCED
jgi:hypothetical protein